MEGASTQPSKVLLRHGGCLEAASSVPLQLFTFLPIHPEVAEAWDRVL